MRRVQRPWHSFYPADVAPSAVYPAIPLWGFLERAAGEHAEKVAVVDGEQAMSYAALWTRVQEAAGWMRASGAGPGDRVMLRLSNSIAFPVAYYGALRAGCVAVAVHPDLPEAEVKSIAEDVEPALVLDDEHGPGAAAPPPPEPPGLAVLQATSGTTGRPKAARMSHANLVANALQNARWFGWRSSEVVLGVLPLCHTWGMCVCLNSTFAVGDTLVLQRRFDPRETLEAAARHRATVLYGSATMFWRLLDLPPHPLPHLRHAKAGAMLSQGGLKERWDAAYPGAPLQQGYGLTEASPECHNNPPHRFKRGTVGVPIQDTDCTIRDPEDPGRVLPPGEAGEVCLKGPQVTEGYWRRPGETAAAFHDGWLRTGDIGVMDDEGYLAIVDRKKDLLKFRGYTVSPNAVEECLLRHPAVAEAVVVGRPDDRDGDVPTAFVVLKDGAALDALEAHCRERLARWEVPRAFVPVDAIPKNHVGKPLRRVLRDRLAGG